MAELPIDPELFARLQAASPRNEELRRHARFQKSGPISLHLSHQRQPLLAQILDISASGIGLTYGRPIEKGTQFSIQFLQGKVSRTVKYRVVRCACDKASGYKIGAEVLHVSQRSDS